jgi:predicted MPP superfamily phosphohydrolase
VENTSPSRHFPSKGDLQQAASGTEGMFRILLSHDPLHWEAEVVGQDFPLTLSGHTHAMQFSLLGWSPSRLMFPQYRGLYSTGDTGASDEAARSADASDKTVRGGGASDIWADPAEMTQKASQQYLHVNPGLGETIFPARIGVRPEITLITLKSRDNR